MSNMKNYQKRNMHMLILALIHWAGGLYGRILTKVVSTDQMQRGLHTVMIKVRVLPYD